MNIENTKYSKIFFTFLIGLTIIIIMSGSYLPMVDLPQHAAQVATLNDILKEQSNWSNLTELNFNTPYLIGYLLWLLLAQLFEIVLASRIFISLIFIFFIFCAIKLKSALNTSWLVPWIAIPSFFGFCYEWGFVTYLLAVSIGILFFIQNIKWSCNPSLKQVLIVTFLGIALFYSHILSFLFFCLLSFVYVFFNIKNKKYLFKILPSYFLFFCLVVLYVYWGDSLSNQYNYGVKVIHHSIGDKILNLMIYPWSMLDKNFIYFSLVLLFIPFLMGYKLSPEVKKYIPLIVFILVWFALPHFMNNTYFIYERYSILFFLFYYLIFEKKYDFKYSNYFSFIFLILIVCLMIEDYKNIFLAKKETTDFVTIVEKLPANKRVLGLIFEPISASVSTPFTYVHFASWYQAQKGGWSDFNFAWFHPQIVRYKSLQTPEVRPGFEWMPQNIQYLKSCNNYDFLIVRAYNISVNQLIENSLCKDYYLSIQHGSWFIFEKNK